ncbi:MAG TPA: hypothetical protein VG518_00880 [Solirubrobacterales bacterium]|nr:hypothetical protein [Solirubrobacterales bacterium]
MGGPTPPLLDSPQVRLESALRRFNASPEARVVAGLTRALGEPLVSVGSLAGSASEVRITVAWELSWYQWGVDLHEEAHPVFEIAKGGEVDELDLPARQWNATAARGQISMGIASKGSRAGRH